MGLATRKSVFGCLAKNAFKQPRQLQRHARILEFMPLAGCYFTYQRTNNKGDYQSVLMCRLLSAFNVHMQKVGIFRAIFRARSNKLCHKKTYM